MTREEQIYKASLNEDLHLSTSEFCAFEKGARWADNNPCGMAEYPHAQGMEIQKQIQAHAQSRKP